jgi:hypothetical protein
VCLADSSPRCSVCPRRGSASLDMVRQRISVRVRVSFTHRSASLVERLQSQCARCAFAARASADISGCNVVSGPPTNSGPGRAGGAVCTLRLGHDGAHACA